RIERGQALIVRIEHEVARHALGPVAAGVLAGVEQPQVVVLAHALASILRGGRSRRDRPPAEPCGRRANACRGRCVDGCTAALEPHLRGTPQMKHRILFTALALAVLTAAGAAAAEPAASTQRSAKATLDVNGDGVIDH